jgi:hypothetical protein
MENRTPESSERIKKKLFHHLPKPYTCARGAGVAQSV